MRALHGSEGGRDGGGQDGCAPASVRRGSHHARIRRPCVATHSGIREVRRLDGRPAGEAAQEEQAAHQRHQGGEDRARGGGRLPGRAALLPALRQREELRTRHAEVQGRRRGAVPLLPRGERTATTTRTPLLRISHHAFCTQYFDEEKNKHIFCKYYKPFGELPSRPWKAK